MNNKHLKPLISLIIPTRERADTLSFTIKAALNQNSDSYEVIVSDNFSQDNTKEVVQSFNDSRLVYINSGKRLSMCDNWDFALEHAKGEYIIFIGDDDAIMPESIDKLQITIKNKPNLVYCWPRVVYNWPKNDQRASVSCLSPNTNPFDINLKKLAKFIVSIGGGRSTFLPSVYHGAIAKSILDIIKDKTGRVFHSTYPDIFIAFATPVFSDTATNVGYTVTVTGRSPKANSGIIYNDRDGTANAERFFKEYENYKIHLSLFPKINVLANLLADTILVAMDKFPQFYGDMYFNYNATWAYINQHSKSFKWGITMKDIIQERGEIRKYHSFSVFKFLGYCILYKLSALYRIFSEKNINLGPFYKNVPDNIDDFVKRLSDYQKETQKNSPK